MILYNIIILILLNYNYFNKKIFSIKSMEHKEEILLNEPEFVETKASNKVKYTIAIIATTLVLATATTLLIGHFKFDWFKNDNYKIDANINRNLYQANYFSEKRQ